MFRYNLSPLKNVSTNWLRSNLRYALEQVNYCETRFCVLRRGRPVAGIVPITEARAIFEATRADRKFRDVHLQQQVENEERLRTALKETAEADLLEEGRY